MKTRSILKLAAMAATAACLLAQSALASSFYPPDTISELTGTLTFLPSQGGTQPFTCDVTFKLKTHVGNADILTAKFKRKDNCKQIVFIPMPQWQVIAEKNLSSGVILGGSWGAGGEQCYTGGTNFSDNANGVWTLKPGCISGTLTSKPAITVVP